MNLALTLASGTGFSWPSAPVLSEISCRILVLRDGQPCKLGASDGHSVVNVKCLVGSITRTLAIWTSDHADFFSAAWAATAVVALTNRTTHTKGSLRRDQQNQAAAPAATHPIIVKRSPSMMLIKRAARLVNAQNPAKRVRKRLPAKPITFMKVLDTICSILSFF